MKLVCPNGIIHMVLNWLLGYMVANMGVKNGQASKHTVNTSPLFIQTNTIDTW